MGKDLHVRKREFICDVNPAATDRAGNPIFKTVSCKNGLLTSIANLGTSIGITQTFPWLSNVAQFFDKFFVHELNFDYVPTTGTNTEAEIALCPSYDAAAPLVGETKQDFLDADGTVRGPAYRNLTCKLDKSKMHEYTKSHYIANKKTVGPEARQNEPARLNVIASVPETNAETNLGELWVDYDVTLSTPKPLGLIGHLPQYCWASVVYTTGSSPTYSTYSQGGSFCQLMGGARETSYGTFLTFTRPGYYLIDGYHAIASGTPTYYTACGSQVTKIRNLQWSPTGYRAFTLLIQVVETPVDPMPDRTPSSEDSDTGVAPMAIQLQTVGAAYSAAITSVFSVRSIDNQEAELFLKYILEPTVDGKLPPPVEKGKF